jgi:Tol biopolymer transport system component
MRSYIDTHVAGVMKIFSHTANIIPSDGVLTLTLEDPTTHVSGMYKIALPSGIPTIVEGTQGLFAPSFSRDGRKAVAVLGEGDAPQILAISGVNTAKETQSFTPPSPALFAGASRWSADNKFVVYEAGTAYAPDASTDIANARVVLLDAESEGQVIVDEGTSPVFLTDGSMLYIKRDGVYRINHDGLTSTSPAESATRVVFFENYEATRNSRIALSNDGHRLLVTHPDSVRLTLYTFTLQEDTLVVASDAQAQRVAWWPVFSPDDTHVAFFAQDVHAESNAPLFLTVTDLVTGNEYVVPGVRAYNDRFMSISTWTK